MTPASTAAAATLPPTESKRLQRWKDTIAAALQHARGNVDIDAIIEQVYGDDAAHVGADVLHTMLQNLLDNMHEHVMMTAQQEVERLDVANMLVRLERLLHAYHAHDAAVVAREVAAQQAARKALHSTHIMPVGLTPAQWAQYVTIQSMQEQQHTLQEHIAAVQTRVHALQQQHATLQAAYDAQLQTMQRTSAELEAAADACAMLST